MPETNLKLPRLLNGKIEKLSVGEFRAEKGWSQKELAEKSGLSIVTVNKIENQQSTIRLNDQTANILAKTLGVDRSHLFTERQISSRGRPPKTGGKYEEKSNGAKRVCGECFIQNPAHLEECQMCGRELSE